MRVHSAVCGLLALAADLTSAFAITGATTNVDQQSRTRPSRLEIANLASSGPAWDLYVLSVIKVQNRTQSDPNSWFGYAGIHGRPFQAWDGVLGVQPSMGYAMHDSILFGAWHRAFLAGFEQLIVEEALELAASYSGHQKENYMSAARNLRIPYWDWAIRKSLPSELTDAQLVVNTPWGKQTVVNPLTSYIFRPHPSEEQFPHSDGDISQFSNTVRTPDKNGATDINSINGMFEVGAQQLLDKMYLLTARMSDYALFSNTGLPADQRNGSYDSLESVHNMVHGYIGGVGHMGYIPYSAFDPAFYMHHANIDRILAIWSAINPDSYVVPQTNNHGTYAEMPGTIEDMNTPLTPFHRNDQGDFHTAATVRDTLSLGYTYPEVQDWLASREVLASNTRKAFNDLYNPNGALKKRSFRQFEKKPYGPGTRPHHYLARRDNTTTGLNGTAFNATTNAIINSNSTTGVVDTTVIPVSVENVPREWSINLSILRNAKKPFFVNFFLGDAPTDPSTWKTAPNLIVTQPVLADLMMAGMPNATPTPALSSIPLTRALINVEIDPNDVDMVVDFLDAYLTWEISFADGSTEVPEGSVRELKISVVDQEVEMTPSQRDFHIYGRVEEHDELKWEVDY